MKQILLFLVAINTLERLPAAASVFPDAATTKVSATIPPDRSGDKTAATRILIEGVIAEVPSRESQRPSRRHHAQKAIAPGDGRHPDAELTSTNVLWETNFVSTEANNVAGCEVSRFCYVATVGDDLDTLMAVLANDSRVQILSRPRVMTSDGVLANLFIGPTVSYVHGIYSGRKCISSSWFPQFETGVSLQLSPVTSPQGLIVIELRQRIYQFDARKFPDIDVPAVNSAELHAQVLVQDRQTFVLGGCSSTRKNHLKSRNTVLQPARVRGGTLLVASSQKMRRELIVLLRPSVLPALESRTESGERLRSN